MSTIYSLDITSSFDSGLKKIRQSTPVKKLILIFWLIGPILYLFERSPADIWLSIICLAFLIRCFVSNDWSPFNQFWVKCAFSLWVIGIISSFLSPMSNLTLGQGLVWIRFPLFALAAQTWLGKDRDLRVIFFCILVLSFFIMCFILFSEYIIEPKPRLTWPYGDAISGSFIAKTCLSVFCVFSVLLLQWKKNIFLISLFILIVGIVCLNLTGERSNFILVICSITLTFLVVNFSWKKLFIISTSFIFFAVVLANIYPSIYERCGRYIDGTTDCAIKTVSIFKDIPLLNFNTSYWGTWRSGLQQGLEKPILGVGPGGTRHTCGFLKDHWLPGKNYCANHPHNIYIQLFAETGLIGLFFGIIMKIAIILKCFKNRFSIKNCPLSLTAFVIPFGIFFPIQHFGSFYGQWGNLFIWFSIGFALSNLKISNRKSLDLVQKNKSNVFNRINKILFFLFFLVLVVFSLSWERMNRWFNFRIYGNYCHFEYKKYFQSKVSKEKLNKNLSIFCDCRTQQLEKLDTDIITRLKLINNEINQIDHILFSSKSRKFREENDISNKICFKHFN